MFQTPEVSLEDKQANIEVPDEETNTLTSLTSVSSFTSMKSFTSATSIWSSLSSVSISSCSSSGYPDTPRSQNSLSSHNSLSINSDEENVDFEPNVTLIRTRSYLTSIAVNELGDDFATSIAPVVKTEATNNETDETDSQREIDQHRFDGMAITDDVGQSSFPSRRRLRRRLSSLKKSVSSALSKLCYFCW